MIFVSNHVLTFFRLSSNTTETRSFTFYMQMKWIDNSTLVKSIEKLEKMGQLIGYPGE